MSDKPTVLFTRTLPPEVEARAVRDYRAEPNETLNRPINQMISEHGFSLTDTRSAYLEGPRLLSYCSWGRATR